MSGIIHVAGWEAANTIVEQLTLNGYLVKIEAEKERTNTDQTLFKIEFFHPVFEVSSCELDHEEFEGTRTWKEIKLEMGDGLDHLTAEPVWSTKGDTDGDPIQNINKKVEVMIKQSGKEKTKRKK